MAEERDDQDVNLDTGQPATPIVDWDDSEMRSSYANVVNVSSTREEVNVFFGTNQTWKAPADRKFHVRLNDRIALNPYAAKRLWILLGAVLSQYEKRFGPLQIDTGAAAKSPGSTSVQ